MRSPREGLGALLRSLLQFVQEKGLEEQVRAGVSEATRKLMDDPPRPLSWIPSASIDEIETVLGALAGKDVLVEFGGRSAREFGGSMIQPVIRAAFLMFGESPASVFANLDRFFTLATRGISFRWTESSPSDGAVEARFEGTDKPVAAWHVLRGSLGFVFEISQAAGEVDPPEVIETTDAATVVRYRVRWK